MRNKFPQILESFPLSQILVKLFIYFENSLLLIICLIIPKFGRKVSYGLSIFTKSHFYWIFLLHFTSKLNSFIS